MKAPPRAKPEPTRTYPRATYLIKELERALRQRIDAIAEPLGLTAVQYTALSVLAGHPGISSAQLARRSFVSAQAANEMVAVLERQNLIRRHPAAEGRELWIHLTPMGERTLARCDGELDAVEAELFAGLTRREEAQFRQMLRTCRDAVRARVHGPARRVGRG